jgi:hypothetical protein
MGTSTKEIDMTYYTTPNTPFAADVQSGAEEIEMTVEEFFVLFGRFV